MADKEERIYISYYKNNPCKNCGKDYCAEGTCFCDIEFARSIPVTKAIEVMAKAICRQDNLLESCKQCLTQCDKQKQKNMCEHILKKRKDNIEPSYFDKAEAALNALLKGGKL